MTLVTAQMSISLDGFYAGPQQDDCTTGSPAPRPPGSSA